MREQQRTARIEEELHNLYLVFHCFDIGSFDSLNGFLPQRMISEGTEFKDDGIADLTGDVITRLESQAATSSRET